MANTIQKTDSFIEALGLDRSKVYIFFELLVLARAVTAACHAITPVRIPPPEDQNDEMEFSRTHGLEKLSECYLIKLAHLCSNTPSTGDISAIVLLQDGGDILYVVGSNNQNRQKQEETGRFVRSLFETLNVEDAVLQDTRTQRQVSNELTHIILLFHKKKVNMYLNGVINEIRNCAGTDEDHAINKDLRKLLPIVERCKACAAQMCDKSFINTSTNERLMRARTEYVSSIQSLFPELKALKRMLASIYDPSRPGTDLTNWGDLLHWIGRILSYAAAPDIFIASRQAWPVIFSASVKLVFIPSSTRMPNPFPPARQGPKAIEVINRAFNNVKDRNTCLEDVETILKVVDLDSLIHKEIMTPSFRPCLHAEILVHDWLLRSSEGTITREMFFFGRPFIGVGKPPCRPCWSYISNHPSGIGVKKSHGNIYPAWRMPDGYLGIGLDIEKDRNETIEKVKDDLRLLIKRTLADRRARKKTRDTETSSSRPSVVGGFLEGIMGVAGSQRAGPGRLLLFDEGPSVMGLRDLSSTGGERSRVPPSSMAPSRPPSSIGNDRISWEEDNLEKSLAKLSLDRGSSTSRISTNSSTGASSGSTSGGEGSSLGSPISTSRAGGDSETSDGDSDDDGGGVVLFRGRGGKATGGRRQ